MAGIAQLWLAEDELDFLLKAAVRYVPFGDGGMATRKVVLDKVRPLAAATACALAEGESCRLREGPVPESPMYRHGYDDGFADGQKAGFSDGFEDGYESGWDAAGGAPRE